MIATFAMAAASWAGTMAGPAAWAAPVDSNDEPTPCRAERIALTASPTQAAVGHRALNLIFSLAGGAVPCTLTGYPGVDSGAGGPLIHAQPTLRGYMGGLPASVTEPPTVIVSLSQQAQTVVESIAVDAGGGQCPTYTDLLVNPPDTPVVFTVPATIEACQLQVHPITEAAPRPGESA
ncbi:hypothetical protein I546_5895 [Mycobacterium kansasii 732]|nr:hypothetical protein I546_5895 [Mycobacterium kansasii 732]